MPRRETVDPVRSFVWKTQAKALVLGICGCMALCIPWTWREGIGFLCGAVLSAVNLQLMFSDAAGMAGRTAAKTRRFITGRALLRYAIMGGYLAVVATKTALNVYTAFAGLLSVQAVILGGAVFSLALPGRSRG